MGVDANRELVLRFLDEGVRQGKVEIFDEICSADLVNHAAAPGRRHGVPALKDVIAFFRRAQPDQRWTERHVVAEGDLVVVYGVREATWQAAEFRGIPTPQGRHVAVELAHMFRVRYGKISEHWAVRDDLGMMQQLDALAPPARDG